MLYLLAILALSGAVFFWMRRPFGPPSNRDVVAAFKKRRFDHVQSKGSRLFAQRKYEGRSTLIEGETRGADVWLRVRMPMKALPENIRFRFVHNADGHEGFFALGDNVFRSDPEQLMAGVFREPYLLFQKWIKSGRARSLHAISRGRFVEIEVVVPVGTGKAKLRRAKVYAALFDALDLGLAFRWEHRNDALLFSRMVRATTAGSLARRQALRSLLFEHGGANEAVALVDDTLKHGDGATLVDLMLSADDEIRARVPIDKLADHANQCLMRSDKRWAKELAAASLAPRLMVHPTLKWAARAALMEAAVERRPNDRDLLASFELLLCRPDPFLIQDAVVLAGDLQWPYALGPIVELLQRGSLPNSVHRECIRAACELVETLPEGTELPAVEKALMAQLDDDLTAVEALRALGQIGGATSAAAVHRLQSEGPSVVQKQAERSLARIRKRTPPGQLGAISISRSKRSDGALKLS